MRYAYGESKPDLRPRVIERRGGRRIRLDAEDVIGMMSPVRCRCGAVYDLSMVHVTARYDDCSVWRTPCCERRMDDRPAPVPPFTRLGRDGYPL